ncbi:MAG: LD-carboxypeptidase [Bacteroidales bacterium]|nr:LD-carboxypeptidase [Bacteroidales bacterium]
MNTPPYLKPGDHVGIIAPARKIKMAEIEAFLALLEKWGLRYKLGKNLFAEENQYSGSDSQRADDFNDMLQDTDVRAIFAARGGYGSIRILRQLDFSGFEKDPKWIGGFSDITVFHSYLSSFLNTESLHCMMPFNYKPGDEESEESAESLRKALFGEKLEYSFPSFSANRIGNASGEIAGGNLSILYSLNGTGFLPDLRTKILFIEDIDEYLYHIDRMMLNLSLSGSLTNIRGLVVGGFTDLKDNAVPFGKDYPEIIREACEKYDFPISFLFPAGHQNRNLTLIFGRQVQLSIEEDHCRMIFSEK